MERGADSAEHVGQAEHQLPTRRHAHSKSLGGEASFCVEALGRRRDTEDDLQLGDDDDDDEDDDDDIDDDDDDLSPANRSTSSAALARGLLGSFSNATGKP